MSARARARAHTHTHTPTPERRKQCGTGMWREIALHPAGRERLVRDLNLRGRGQGIRDRV